MNNKPINRIGSISIYLVNYLACLIGLNAYSSLFKLTKHRVITRIYLVRIKLITNRLFKLISCRLARINKLTRGQPEKITNLFQHEGIVRLNLFLRFHSLVDSLVMRSRVFRFFTSLVQNYKVCHSEAQMPLVHRENTTDSEIDLKFRNWFESYFEEPKPVWLWK